ncbi:hypothetical protein EVAR_24684_1 [Eumeta japonica]|uniref:Uncharacterized protein n=1 Tax=Eumeta variegata TaxID=151549 RepID=A0A4C1WG68_EUMVA|nr:hypothetical protein EVAR_24684_1 [Eumeta japonica]
MANNETDLFHVSEEPIAILSSHQIVFWIIGIIASIFGFLLQLFTMALVPAVRHYDEKLLAHLTLASDYSLICWMFMFTKNLYNKVVIFPNPSHPSWITVYLFCVALPVPVAMLPAATSLINRSQRRLQAASDSSGDMTLLRVVVVTCVLMSVTCLQTFCTDMLSLIDGNNFYAIYCFAVVNSYQGVVITVSMRRNTGERLPADPLFSYPGSCPTGALSGKKIPLLYLFSPCTKKRTRLVNAMHGLNKRLKTDF